jgi:hypothetical protein
MKRPEPHPASIGSSSQRWCTTFMATLAHRRSAGAPLFMATLAQKLAHYRSSRYISA